MIFRKKKSEDRNQIKNSVSFSDLGIPVQKSWIYKLPWKMQTVVNQGLRAPDSIFYPGIKIVCRWMRSVVLNNADHNHTFMCDKKSMPTWEDLDNEINYCTVHFVTHFLYAIQIIAYKHPNSEVRRIAWSYYEGIVKYQMHFEPESEFDLDRRLADVNCREPDTYIKEFLKVENIRELTPKTCPRDDQYTKKFSYED